MKTPSPAQYRKALVALVAFAAHLVASGALPESVSVYVTATIAGLAAIGVYLVPNAPASE